MQVGESPFQDLRPGRAGVMFFHEAPPLLTHPETPLGIMVESEDGIRNRPRISGGDHDAAAGSLEDPGTFAA